MTIGQPVSWQAHVLVAQLKMDWKTQVESDQTPLINGNSKSSVNQLNVRPFIVPETTHF